jgi:hypothetical protein
MEMRDRPRSHSTSATVKAFDIIATSGKQPDNPRQNTRFIIDQNGNDVAFLSYIDAHLDIAPKWLA